MIEPTPTLPPRLARHRNKELLRFLTCGSVDDGKSTLIGRLLHDSEQIYDDQLAAVRRDSAKRGTELDLSLLVDGLEAEREQGITIDVAYRYFATEKRKFIIADTPGHEQYTRNMATGASGCNLAVILIDARNGVLPQTRRHAFIAALLGIKHLVVAINKMDLVDWSEETYERIRAEFAGFAARLQVSDVQFIPVSAKLGENVVHRGANMPWYQGPPLLDFLESVHIASDRNLIDLRFPVQLVVRGVSDAGTGGGRRAYAGTVASGVLRVGDEVVALPGGRGSRVRSILCAGREIEEAFPPLSVAVTLDDEIDVSRGSMLVHPRNRPRLDHSIEAMVVWMAEAPLAPGRPYVLKHTGIQTQAVVTAIRYGVDVNTLHRTAAPELGLNEIGRVALEVSRALPCDAYSVNRTTGAFILIDRLTNATVGAGMIVDRRADGESRGRARGARDPEPAAPGLKVRASRITPAERAERLGQKPFTVWLTGLTRAGKTTLAYALEERLFALGYMAHAIDGESLRLGMSGDLGFSSDDRRENVRRAAELARLENELGYIAIVAMVSPSRADRDAARERIGAERFFEIEVRAPMEVLEARDSEGLYARARAGELVHFPGISLDYEAPVQPELVVETASASVDECVGKVVEALAAARHVDPTRSGSSKEPSN